MCAEYDDSGLARVDRAAAEGLFSAYVEQFDLDDSRIALKYEHTLKVAELCDEIAVSRGMGALDVDLAWLCGLLHDIGRFEQVRRWGTFRDAQSYSHAHLGVALLKGTASRLEEFRGVELKPCPRIEDFIANSAAAETVLTAITLHSDFNLPAALSERARVFCDILRDADKVDILRVNCDCDVWSVLGIGEEAFINGKISEGAMAGFRERRCLSRDERGEVLDFFVGILCFVFELVNEGALEALRQRGYLAKLVQKPFGLEPDFSDPTTQEQWAEITATLQEYL